MGKELLKGLTEEQIAKVEACNSPDEVLALAKAEGVELTSEQLEAVSGGGCRVSRKCPNCGTKDIEKEKWLDPNTMGMGEEYAIRYWSCKCNKCGHEWKDTYYWKG